MIDLIVLHIFPISVENLRYRLPQPITYSGGTYDATKYGLSCGQQSVSLPILTGLVAEVVDFLVNSIYGIVFPDSEDCKPHFITFHQKVF
jgi:acetylcholinesterase